MDDLIINNLLHYDHDATQGKALEPYLAGAVSPNLSFENFKDGYKALWSTCQVSNVNGTKKQALAILANKSTYLPISAETNVPWFVIGIIHTREAGSPPNFRCVLHNGEAIVGTGRRTRLVPAGRGPFQTFKDAAVDALTLEHYTNIKWADGWGPEHVAFVLEKFNGFGYRAHGIPSPYLWGSTTVQKRGKYVSDGHYDPSAMDTQIGGMALLKELMALDPTISFDSTNGSSGTVATPARDSKVEAPTKTPDKSGQTTQPQTAPQPQGQSWISILLNILRGVLTRKR